MHPISVQTGGFYEESNPEKGFALMRECGVEAVDYNINDIIPVRDLTKGVRAETFDKPLDEFLAYFSPMKEAAGKNGVKFAQMHGPFPLYFDGKHCGFRFIRCAFSPRKTGDFPSGKRDSARSFRASAHNPQTGGKSFFFFI